MRKILFIFFVFVGSVLAVSQDAYKFIVVKENPITSIKNQASSGTCWSFSGVGVLESELIRSGKGEYDLSEMYIVRKNYEDKAMKYARLHGHLNFAGGGSFADVFETIDDFGLIPEEAYKGLNYGSDTHNHGELDKVLASYMESMVGSNSLSTAWFEGFKGILDSYLGKVPEKFSYDGVTYTPQSFAKHLGIDKDSYISLTSFTHHEFYKPFAIEVPDNWRWARSYNLPLDELIEIMDNAIMNGYTIAWATDVSEVGFSRLGLAIVPDENSPENAGSDQERWLGQSARERDAELRSRVGHEVLKEKNISQELRQVGFDTYKTTDDHGMQIYGLAKDQNGNKFYMVKNSWGETGPYKGLWYASEPFVKYKTISIVVHKDAIPKNILSKIDL